MDWSLVLVSQGIETAIDYSEDGTGWGILVNAEEYGKALAAIRLYRLENRRWPWRRELFQPGLLFDWGSLAWVLLIVLFFWLGRHVDLGSAGMMDTSAVAQGEWWRLFTAVWLHADVAHLITNATFGLVLLGLAMARYGTGAGLLASYLAGVGGNLASWLLSSEPHRSLGASGMVLGSLGLLAAQSFPLWRKTPCAAKYVLSGILGGVMLFVLLGLTPGTDVMAHSGGFACGLLLGGLFAFVPTLAQKDKINLLCGLFFVLLVNVSWWLALRG